MRQALNDNPVVQAAVVGVLALVVGFVLVTRVAGGGAGSDEPAPAPTPAPAGGESVAGAGSDVDPEVAADATGAAIEEIRSGDAEGAFEAVAGAATSGGFEAGPGLPEKVVEAYDDGKAVAVLITRKPGIEDKRLRAMVSRIEAVGSVAVFHSYAQGVARYSRVTGGVDLSRVPALVVIRPRDESEGGIPVASVKYGFRDAASAEQAVRDALYDGRRDFPYNPYPEPKNRRNG